MLYSPTRGVSVERAFDVVGLKGNHLAYEGDDLVDGLADRADIFGADSEVVYVRMKDGREHVAARQLVRIVASQDYLRAMDGALSNLALLFDQPAQAILYDVTVRRVAVSLHDAYAVVVGKQLSDTIVFGLQSAKSDAHDFSNAPFGSFKLSQSRREG
jgi:hypothetical protein